MSRVLLAAVVSTLATTAFAGVFGEEVFNKVGTVEEPANGWSYTYGNGATPPWSRDLVAASGSDGTQSVKLTADFSTVFLDSWGTWSGMGLGAYLTVSSQPMSVILSEYSFSADMKAVGTYNGTGQQRTKVELQFFCFDDTNPDGTPMATPDADGESQFIASFKSPTLATLTEGAWVTRTGTFDTFTPNNYNHDNDAGTPEIPYTWDGVLAAMAAGNVHGVNLSLAVEDGADAGGAAPGRYGLDAGNELWGDNFSVSVVPEPSSLVLLGVAGLLIGRRRS